MELSFHSKDADDSNSASNHMQEMVYSYEEESSVSELITELKKPSTESNSNTNLIKTDQGQ